ncbi:hypothetical protein COV20_04400 [Candidatus Woesearchaeota archaeon CG10_big_fil_rev_8_21_14_0_10_45_16]|nr:MAG: hypothetical protein COV20_04400 [Candidatus Woesearchaeota archaeon CG10_big_fil_rev_8_21_14_0_10_45_16]
MATYTKELIGEKIEIIDAANKGQKGLKGAVVDETKSTLVIDVGGVHKTLLKNTITFRILGTGEVIDGRIIARRPEERIKGK